MSDLIRLSAAEQSELLQSRQISSVELTQAHLDRIAETDGDLGAFLHVSETAITIADEVDAARAGGL